jgi:RNA polymerase sigma-70 factor, ECF subfamily
MGSEETFSLVLDACRLGAGWAWRQMYDDLAPSVLRFLRFRGAAEPEDLLGETFLTVVRKLPTFSGGEREFRAWVYTIARSRSIDEGRARARRPVRPAPVDELIAHGGSGDVEADALRSLATQRVRRVLERLTDEQRDVLVLRLLEGLTIDEIAQVLGKRPGAVKALQARGIAAIRREVSAGAVTL